MYRLIDAWSRCERAYKVLTITSDIRGHCEDMALSFDFDVYERGRNSLLVASFAVVFFSLSLSFREIVYSGFGDLLLEFFRLLGVLIVSW